MAQVVAETRLDEWIDRSLDYLLRNWAAIPEVAAEWDAWDEPDRLDFVIEWPLREDRWRQLERWAADGLLSAAQRGRYAALQELMRRHRATVDGLLAE